MTEAKANALTTGSNPRSARVKLRRIDANLSRPGPPDGDSREWWGRLKRALATESSDFVNAALTQLQFAARLPGSGVSETAVNAALAFIEGAEPRNEVESALAVQMACTHTAAMAVLARLGGGHGGDRHVATMAAAAGRLLHAFTMQVESFRRLKHGGSQVIRIEHIHVNDGSQVVCPLRSGPP